MPKLIRPSLPAVTSALLLAAMLTACGGGGSSPATSTPPPPVTTPQTVSLALSGSQMLGSAPVTVSATLGQSADVAWSLSSGSPGTLSSTTGGSITYTPPTARVTAITPISITATSSGVSQSVKLALYPDAGAPGLSLLAGSLGARSIVDGAATAARFNNIRALAADSDGSMVVVDRNDQLPNTSSLETPYTIRRVSANGAVSTILATAFGHADGNATQARLGAVESIAVAPDHSIYLVDNVPLDPLQGTFTRYLRRLAADGTLSTIATLNIITAYGSNFLVTVDGAGAVALLSRSALYRVSGGTVTLAAGAEVISGSVDGAAAAARFSSIDNALADNAGNVYVIDNYSVRKIAADNSVSTLAGIAPASTPSVAIDGTGNAARFGEPKSLALESNGNLLVLDRDSNGSGGRTGYLVRRVTPAGVVTTPYAGTDPKQYSDATLGTETPNTRLSVSAANAIVLASTGQLQLQQNATSATLFAGLEGDSGVEKDGLGAAARFVNPSRLAADLSGNVYVLDRSGLFSGADIIGFTVRKITPAGVVSTLPSTEFSSFTPAGAAADTDGNLYIVARLPNLKPTLSVSGGFVYKMTPQGIVTLVAGGKAVPAQGTLDGTGKDAAFVFPEMAGIDSAGNVYLTDVSAGSVVAVTYRKVTPQGVVSTISSLPDGVNKAPDGNTYSASASESVIYRTSASGAKNVVAGQLQVRGTRLDALPGGLDAPTAVVPYGPDSLMVISGAAVLRVVLPH